MRCHQHTRPTPPGQGAASSLRIGQAACRSTVCPCCPPRLPACDICPGAASRRGIACSCRRHRPGGSPAAPGRTAPHAPAPGHLAEAAARTGGAPGRPRCWRVLPGGGMRPMGLLAPPSCCWSTRTTCPALQAPASGPGRRRGPGSLHAPRTLTCSPAAGQRLREEAEAGGGAQDERLRRTRAQHAK